MLKIIDGKRFNTDTATTICISDAGLSVSDFSHENTTLYRSPKGQFFLSGWGGPSSRWRHDSGNGFCEGDGLYLIDALEARVFAEQHGTPEDVEEFFEVEDG